MRIVIGEDSALFREGLASLLTDAGHEVVAGIVLLSQHVETRHSVELVSTATRTTAGYSPCSST